MVHRPRQRQNGGEQEAGEVGLKTFLRQTLEKLVPSWVKARVEDKSKFSKLVR